MTSRGRRLALVALSTGLILAATTFPTSAADVGQLARCVVCGERGVADALVNILLFAPFGATLALSGWRPGRVVVVGAALFSGLIELAQLVLIPGRDPSIGDVLFNSLGAAAGFALVGTAAAWLTPTRSRAALFAWTWSGVIAATIMGTGLLLAPALSHLDYYGGWTLRLRHLDWYGGRVLEATLGSSALPSALVDDSDRVRAALLAGDTLRVRAVAGPRTSELAPVVMVNDERQHEMMLLGVDRDALVFRYRTRSTALRLGQPDLRASDAMVDVAVGDSLVLVAWREGDAYCLQRDGVRRCGLGYTAGRAWSTLMYPESMPSWLVRSLDAAWMVALFIPLGFWVRMTAAGALALVPAGLALVIVPSFAGLLPPAPGEIAAALIGVIVGSILARGARRGIGDRSGAASSFAMRPVGDGPAVF